MSGGGQVPRLRAAALKRDNEDGGDTPKDDDAGGDARGEKVLVGGLSADARNQQRHGRLGRAERHDVHDCAGIVRLRPPR